MEDRTLRLYPVIKELLDHMERQKRDLDYMQRAIYKLQEKVDSIEEVGNV